MEENLFTVTELTDQIKSALEDNFPGIWVSGEISNYLHHSSGHRYFTLKDADAQIKCVIWKFVGQHLIIRPDNGMKVKIFGDVTVYPRGGVYQIRVAKLLPIGVGDLEVQFQKLKERLYKGGLFDEDHKKPLPDFPQRIGLITSPTGAAIRDMINILRRRAPWVEIILAPVHVQGERAAEEIADSIEKFNRYGKVDLLITGRGGGSLEDLWAFNEEVVARAIYASDLPVISAVGHQIDYTISDFVADLRAPTPSAAAELAVPDRQELADTVNGLKWQLSHGAMTYINLAKEKLSGLMRSPVLKHPTDMIYYRAQLLDELRTSINKRILGNIDYQKQSFSALNEKLLALSPMSILKRGYAVVRKSPQRDILRDSREVSRSDKLNIKLYKGMIDATVDEVRPERD